MRGIYTPLTKLRRQVFAAVAKMAYEDDVDYAHRIEEIPYEIIPGELPRYRDSVFKERAIIGERLRLAIGLSLYPVDRPSPISKGVNESAIAEKLHANRAIDSGAKRAVFGVHKSEFSAIHIPTQMEAQNCSTGEQKALIIGLILAQARLVSLGLNNSENACFKRPNVILLLDEAQAHFDSKRREALARETLALNGQIWLTGTDKYLFEAFDKSGEYYSISPSRAEQINI